MKGEDIVEKLRREQFLLGRLCRILQRVRPALSLFNTSVFRTDYEAGAAFYCNSEEAALAIGKELRIDVKLKWGRGSSSIKQSIHDVDGLHFAFNVELRRPIAFSECVVRKSRKRCGGDWVHYRLVWNEMVLTEASLVKTLKGEHLKRALWKLAVDKFDKTPRFKNYEFVGSST